MKIWVVHKIFLIKKKNLSVEVLVSWGWNIEFLKTKTYPFAYFAPEAERDYISVVLFVFMGCALEGKMQIPSESQDDIVMVHNLLEIAVQLQRVSPESSLHSYSTNAVQSTEHHTVFLKSLASASS